MAKARTPSEIRLTHARLVEKLSYGKETGEFRSRVPQRGRAMGSLVGGLESNGYLKICIDGEAFRAHRLAWFYVYKEWPNGEIDHVNGVRTDNRLCNLRVVTSAQNKQNKRLAGSRSSTKTLGVYKATNGGFRAAIGVNGRPRHIGVYKTIQEASAAYWEVKKLVHPFAVNEKP